MMAVGRPHTGLEEGLEIGLMVAFRRASGSQSRSSTGMDSLEGEMDGLLPRMLAARRTTA